MKNMIRFAGCGHELYQIRIIFFLMFLFSSSSADVKVKTDVSAVSVRRGEEFSFTCTVTGELKLHHQISLNQYKSRHSKCVIWNDLDGMNAKGLNEEGKGLRYSVSNVAYVVNSITHWNITLRVKDVDKNDEGDYGCTLHCLKFPLIVSSIAAVQVSVIDDILQCRMYPTAASSNRFLLYCYAENATHGVDLQWEDSIGNILPSVRSKENGRTVLIAKYNLSHFDHNVSFTCGPVGPRTGWILRPCIIAPLGLTTTLTVTPVQVLEPGESALFMCNVSSVSARIAWWKVTDKDDVAVTVRRTFGRYNVSPSRSLLRIENVTLFDHYTVVECVIDSVDDDVSGVTKGTLYVFAKYSKLQNAREESDLNQFGSTVGRGHYSRLGKKNNNSEGTDWSNVKRQPRNIFYGSHHGSNETMAQFATTKSPVVKVNNRYLTEKPATNVSSDGELSIPSQSFSVLPTIVCSFLLFSIFASIALLIIRLLRRQDQRDVGTASYQVQHSDSLSILSDTVGMQSRKPSLPLARSFVGTIRKPSAGLPPIPESSIADSKSLPNHKTKYIHFLESSDDELPPHAAYQLSQPLPDVTSIRLSSTEGAVAVLMNAAASGKGDSISSGEFCYRTASEKITTNVRDGHSRVRKIAPKSKSLMKQRVKDRVKDRRFRRSPSEQRPNGQTGGILYTEIDWSNTVPRTVVNFSSERTVYAIVDTMKTSYQYDCL